MVAIPFTKLFSFVLKSATNPLAKRVVSGEQKDVPSSRNDLQYPLLYVSPPLDMSVDEETRSVENGVEMPTSLCCS